MPSNLLTKARMALTSDSTRIDASLFFAAFLFFFGMLPLSLTTVRLERVLSSEPSSLLSVSSPFACCDPCSASPASIRDKTSAPRQTPFRDLPMLLIRLADTPGFLTVSEDATDD